MNPGLLNLSIPYSGMNLEKVYGSGISLVIRPQVFNNPGRNPEGMTLSFAAA